MRISATDWAEGGWDIDESVEFARRLKAHGRGSDRLLVGRQCRQGEDSRRPRVSDGVRGTHPARGGHYTGAVGLITAPAQAEHIIRSGQADLVILARELLRDPYWPLRAAQELGYPMPWPAQYLRAAPAGAPERTPAHELD